MAKKCVKTRSVRTVLSIYPQQRASGTKSVKTLVILFEINLLTRCLPDLIYFFHKLTSGTSSITMARTFNLPKCGNARALQLGCYVDKDEYLISARVTVYVHTAWVVKNLKILNAM